MLYLYRGHSLKATLFMVNFVADLFDFLWEK